MSVDRIKHGQTFNLVGTLTATETLIGLTGAPGALIEVSGTAASRGTILLKGASLPHKQGAVLIDTGVFSNAGLINIGGGTYSSHAALMRIDGTLINNGVVAAGAGVHGAGGQIGVGGKLRNNATLTLAAGIGTGSLGATLSVGGQLVNNANGVIDVRGEVFDGNANDSGGAGAVLTVVSGTFTNDGTLAIYNAFAGENAGGAGTVVVAGVLQNTGHVQVGINSYYVSSGALLSIVGSLSNSGTIDVTGTSGYRGNTSGGLPPRATLAVSGTLLNQGAIVVDSGGSGGHYTNAGRGALLQDIGTVQNSGTLTIGLDSGTGYYFKNDLEGASLVVAGVLTNSGTVLLQENSNIDISGVFTNSAVLTAPGGLSVAGELYTYLGGGGLISVDGTLTNTAAGTVMLGGGLSAKSDYSIFQSVGGYGADMEVSGLLSNAGEISIGGGAGGYGSAFNHYGYIGTGGTLSVASRGVLSNTGTIRIEQGQTSVYGVYGGGGLLVDAGSLFNAGLLTIAGGDGISNGQLQISQTGFLSGNGTISGGGVLLNQGVISDNGPGGLITGVSFVNDGTVNVYGGKVEFDLASAVSADVGRSGVFDVSNGATLALQNSFTGSQTVSFAGSNDLLKLGDAFDFSGTLSGIAATDKIDFLKLDVISATATGDTLTIGLASGTIDLALAAPLAGLDLTLQSDGHAGTKLVFSAAHPPH